MAGVVQAALQFFARNQGQKAAEYVAPDIFVPLMEYRPGFEQCFNITKKSKKTSSSSEKRPCRAKNISYSNRSFEAPC